MKTNYRPFNILTFIALVTVSFVLYLKDMEYDQLAYHHEVALVERDSYLFERDMYKSNIDSIYTNSLTIEDCNSQKESLNYKINQLSKDKKDLEHQLNLIENELEAADIALYNCMKSK